MKKLAQLILLLFSTQLIFAQTQVLNYQGVLLDNNGQPVVDGTYNAVFELFDSISGGSALWTDTNVGITTSNGSFSVRLGSGSTPIPTSVDFTQTLWLGIAVNGSPFGARVQIDPDPTALTLKRLDASNKDSLRNELNQLKSQLEALINSRGSSVPIGTVQAFAGDTASIPEGWLLCDGSKYPVSQYEKLAEVLNNYWGAQDIDFFVPDLTGHFLRGASATVANLDDLKERRNNGTSSGDLVGLFQAWTTGPPRIRAFTGSTGSWGSSAHPTTGVGDHSHSANASLGRYNDAGQNGGWAREGNHGTRAVTNPAGAHNHTVDLRHTHTIAVTAGGDLETRPANAFVHYIIKAK